MAPKRKAAAASAASSALTTRRSQRAKHAPAAASGPPATPQIGKTATTGRKRRYTTESQAVAQNSGGGAASQSTAAAAAQSAAAAPAKRQVDQFCGTSGLEVVGEYDVTLNQTNIGANANKFYRLQMLRPSKGNQQYLVWTRWGRVGVPGQSKMLGPYADAAGARHQFEAKFRDKTGFSWHSRGSIEAKMGKYAPVEVDPSVAPPPPQQLATPAKKGVKYAACSLDGPTQELIELILADDTFTNAMADFEIDVDRFPLGQLTQAQVQKGLDILQDLRNALGGRPAPNALEQLSSRFYQTIPHSFGMRRPPVLNTVAAINRKVDMCNVLTDIEIAQSMLGDTATSEPELEEEVHPTDDKYRLLNANLELLGAADPELSVIQQYIQATLGGRGTQAANVWRVARQGEGERFSAHDGLANRRLLWHGTNVAVVAAVLKTGLRIMPHSGGRVGKGIYLASELAKSWAYTSPGNSRGKHLGVLFLTEAALGKEHTITRDDSRLTSPASGFHSVVARGSQEPDPKKDTTIDLDGKRVHVPQAAPVRQPQFDGSSFSQSEYLLYQESQACIRYAVTFDFGRHRS